MPPPCLPTSGSAPCKHAEPAMTAKVYAEATKQAPQPRCLDTSTHVQGTVTSPLQRAPAEQVSILALDDLSLGLVLCKAATTRCDVIAAQLVCKRFRAVALQFAASLHLTKDLPLGPFTGLRRLRISAGCTALPWNGHAELGWRHPLAPVSRLEIDDDVVFSEAEVATLPAKLTRLPALRVLIIRSRQASQAAADIPFCPPSLLAMHLNLSAVPALDGRLGIVMGLPLQSLDLSDSDVSDAGLAHLAGARALRTLELRNMKGLRGWGLQHLGGLPVLQTLSLHGCSALNPATFAHISGLTRLTALDLSYTGRALADSDHPGAGALRHVAGLMALKVLLLRGSSVRDNDLQHLSGLSALRVLDLRYNLMTGRGLQALARLRALRHLVLSCAVDSDCWAHLTHLSTLTALSLDDSCQLGDAGTQHLAALPALKHLHLADLEGVPDLCTLTRLTSLSLAFYHEQDDVSFGALAQLSRMSALTDLTVRVDSDEAKPLLEHLGQLTSVRKLRVCEDYFDDSTLCGRGVGRLSGLSRLQELAFETCGRLDRDLRQLSALPGLRKVSFHTRRLYDADLKHVAGLRGLTAVHFDEVVRVSERGWRHLSGLPSLRSLTLNHMVPPLRAAC